MGSPGQEAVDGLFKTAIDAGVNFIDTANVYSFGASEELTGQAIRNTGINRDQLRFTPDEMEGLDAVSRLTPEYPGWVLEATAKDRVGS